VYYGSQRIIFLRTTKLCPIVPTNNLCSVEFQQIYLFAEEIISHFV